VNIDSRLEILKSNLIGSLNELQASYEYQIESLAARSGKISSKIASAPQFEKEFKDITREQETKNALYLLLLQKREESILSNAVQVNRAKIIDPAYSSLEPISPKKKLVLIFSVLMGIILPVMILYVYEIFDTKVRSEKDIRMLNLPYLGEIPIENTKMFSTISQHGNSSIAEAFRFLRTNLNFILDGNHNKCKTIMITSTMSGEGKTFTAINLASSIALTGKKTLLLGMDLRAPAIKETKNKDYKGVSNFIIDHGLSFHDVIIKSKKFDNLDLIQAGDIPPNPVELLMSNRVKKLFEYADDQYDYVIIDSSPVGMVADEITLEKYADLIVYVIRANYLDRRMLHIPEKLDRTGKLRNMAVLINGMNLKTHKYGYGYGYSRENKKNTWYRRIFTQESF
jgi:capsular exopolysaccharide synthesis family protein